MAAGTRNANALAAGACALTLSSMAQVIELLVHGGFAYFDQEEERIIAINTLTAKRTANAFCFGLSPLPLRRPRQAAWEPCGCNTLFCGAP